MAYTFLKLDPIPKYVDERLKLYTNNKEVSKLGIWIKLTSSAGPIDESTRRGLTIISNPNIPTFGIQSIHGTLDVNAPIGSKSYNGDESAYESLEPRGSGYRPRPIVDNISIKNATRGLSRKAEFSITCFSQEQVDQISQYFLEPGFTIAIEWGWNVTESYQQVSTTVNELADLQNFEILNRKREQSNGTYDGYIGFITGGGITQSDGSFTINVSCSGIGEIFSYIQQQNNSSKTDEEVGDDEVSGISISHTRDTTEAEQTSFIYMFNDLPSKFRTELVEQLINDDEVSFHTNFINFIPKVRKTINKTTKSRNAIVRFFTRRLGTVQTKENSSVVIPSGDGIISDERYIRFGTLMRILNAGNYDLRRGVELSNGKTIPISINTNNVPISAFRNIFSLDGSKLYIPNSRLPNFGLHQAFNNPNRKRSFSENAKDSVLDEDPYNPQFLPSPSYAEFPRRLPLSNYINDIQLSANSYEYGFLNDLYINFDFAISVINKKGLSIREVMYELLNGLSAAVNNMWDFQIIEDEDENGELQLSVVDYNFTGFKEFNPIQYVTNGVNSPFESFNLDVDIPGAMMNQIIGRRLSSESGKFDPQTELDELPNRLFGDGVGFKDYIMKEIRRREPVSTDNGSDVSTTSEESTEDVIRRNFEFFLKNSVIIPNITSLKSDFFVQIDNETSSFMGDADLRDTSKNPLDYVIVGVWRDEKLFEHLRTTANGSVTERGLSPLLPIKTNWSTFGVSGIRNGLTYRILDLPEKFRDRGIFQITEVEHIISGMTWKTSVEGQFRQTSE